jgi:hypothetical protein
MVLLHLKSRKLVSHDASISILYLNSTGLTGAPSLYTVANENMKEKNPDIQIVVANNMD